MCCVCAVCSTHVKQSHVVELVVRQAVSHLYRLHMKVCQRALLTRKRLSRLHLLQFTAAQGERQTLLLLLLRACGEEVFGSLHTLPHSAILTCFAPQLTGVTCTAKQG